MFLVLRTPLHGYIRTIIKICIYHTIFTKFTYIHDFWTSAHQGQNNTDKSGEFAHTPPLIPPPQYNKFSPVLLFKTNLKHKNHYQSPYA